MPSNHTPSHTISQDHFGLAFILTASHILFFSLSAIVSKTLAAALPIENQLLVRALFTALGIVLLTRGNVFRAIPRTLYPWLLGRGILGFYGAYGTFYSFTTLPIALAMMITASTPLWVMLMGKYFLRETFAKENLLALVIVLLSIYGYTHAKTASPATGIDSINLLIAFSATLSTAAAFLTIRKISAQVSSKAIVLSFALCGIIGFGCLSSANLKQHLLDLSGHGISLLALLCLLGIASDFSKTKAYQYAPAWWVSLLSVFTVAASGILAWWLLDETLIAEQWLAISVLILTLTWTIYRSQRTKPRANNP